MIWELFSYLYTTSSLGGQLASAAAAARPSPNFRVASIFGRFQKQTHTTTIVAVEETIGKRKQKSFSLSKTTSTLELLLLLWWWKESSAWRKLMPSKVFPLFPLLLSLNSSFSNLNSAWAFEASVKYHIWPPKGKVIFQKFTFQRKMGANFSIGEEEGREGGGWARKRKGGSKKTKKSFVMIYCFAAAAHPATKPRAEENTSTVQWRPQKQHFIPVSHQFRPPIPISDHILFIFLLQSKIKCEIFSLLLKAIQLN